LAFDNASARSGAARQPLRVESSTDGDLGFVAHGVALVDVLRALAAEGGFEIVIDPTIKRPPVTLTVPVSAVEDALRNLLRGRNYSLVFDAETESVSQVFVLEPSVPGKASPAPRKAAKKKQAQQGAIVVRR
jgi:hypothetical protein